MRREPLRALRLTSVLLSMLVTTGVLHSQDPETDHRRTPVVRVVEQAKPAVVSIVTNKMVLVNYGFFGTRNEERQGEGTGVVVFAEGYVVTNYHVVEGATEINVRFDEVDDDRTYVAKLVAREKGEDLALLRIVDGGTFPTIPMSDTDPILGETVVAIGNAYGNSHTVSTGIISGLRRDVRAEELHFTDLLQTDAAINPGNSGGPLLNIDGELIGINTAVKGYAENIGYAIPVARVRYVLYNELLSLDQAKTWLGFEANESFEIDHVFPGGPAHESGIQVGDRIVSIGGTAIESESAYNLARISIEPMESVTIRVRRDGKLYDAQVEAINWYDGVIYERMGLIAGVTRLGRRRSVPFLQVRAVDPKGPAAAVGIQPDDILAAIRPVGGHARHLRSLEDLAFLVGYAGEDAEFEVEIWRDDDGDGTYERSEVYSEAYLGEIRLR